MSKRSWASPDYFILTPYIKSCCHKGQVSRIIKYSIKFINNFIFKTTFTNFVYLKECFVVILFIKRRYPSARNIRMMLQN